MKTKLYQILKMSSIFRNGFDDTDESSGGSSGGEAFYNESISNSETKSNERGTKIVGGNTLPSNVSGAVTRLGGPLLPELDAQHHSTLFYLSLIEGRCRTQAANSINRGRLPSDRLLEDHPEVLELARHLFAEISQEFHKAGVLPDEFASQNLEALRSQYLKSFDRIVDNIALRQAQAKPDQNSLISVDESHLLAFSNNNNIPSFKFTNALALQRLTMAGSYHVPGLSSFMLKSQNNDLYESTKSVYKTEYKEICLIGTGGFGAVYKVQNHIDQQEVWTIDYITSREYSTSCHAIKSLFLEDANLGHSNSTLSRRLL